LRASGEKGQSSFFLVEGDQARTEVALFKKADSVDRQINRQCKRQRQTTTKAASFRSETNSTQHLLSLVKAIEATDSNQQSGVILAKAAKNIVKQSRGRFLTEKAKSGCGASWFPLKW
jgi:hypothetical protein